jgi:hypothetical protein
MSFAINGYEILNNLISQSSLQKIKYELDNISANELKAGIRNADKKFTCINQLVKSSELLSQAAYYLGSPANIVRAILFDKTPGNNWLVSWHQDKTISVSERCDIENWGPWSLKDGVHHVQPPLNVLNQIVTFRIHIDDSTIENGCLRVMPKSHLEGILSTTQISEIVKSNKAVSCVGESGSILVMKPHLLHSSSKAITPSQRRVVHVEYSNYTLPFNLSWA